MRGTREGPCHGRVSSVHRSTPSHLTTPPLPRLHGEASVDCLHSVSDAACSGARGGSVAAYARRVASACGSSGISRFNACSKRPRLSNTCSQHSRWRHKYAPRPAFLPVASASTRFAAVRTIRTSSRLGRTVRQAMHVRCGICFAMPVFECRRPIVVLPVHPNRDRSHAGPVAPSD